MPAFSSNPSLSRRLWLVLLLAVVPLLVLTINDYQEDRRGAVVRIEQQARLMVQGVRIEETAVLRQVAQLLGSMAEANDMDDLDPRPARRLPGA